MIIRRMKKAIKRIMSYKTTSEEYIKYLKKRGIKIGKGVRFFDPDSTTIDIQNPHMLKIGNNVRITKGVTILTHDYSWSVLAGVYGECLGGTGSVKVGDNVFIGMHSIVLKDTEIGDNVIIGAGSVVKGKIESNSVYAGIPAKKIMSLDNFYKKKKDNFQDEAQRYVQMYKDSKGRYPNECELKEYFWLFSERNDLLNNEFEELMRKTGYFDYCKKHFYDSTPKYNGLNDFIQNCNYEE